MEKLKDIKDIVEVQDYSLYLFISLILVVFILIFLFLYFLKKRKKRKKPTQKQIALKKLKELNYNHTKNTVYTFCENFIFFVDEKNKIAFENLEKSLEKYKYKKDVDNLSQELKDEIKNMIKVIK